MKFWRLGVDGIFMYADACGSKLARKSHVTGIPQKTVTSAYRR